MFAAARPIFGARCASRPPIASSSINKRGRPAALATNEADRWLRFVCLFLAHLRNPPVAPILLVAAHPDDEAIGAGAHLAFWPDVRVAHVTDGAPRNHPYARDAVFPNRAAYAAARRREAQDALIIAGIAAERIVDLAFVDQEATFHLREISERIAALIAAMRPAVIVTHAYEGGHPDHDATCFAVHAARRIVARSGVNPPDLVEMSAYFGNGRQRVTGTFLLSSRTPVVSVLDEVDRARKRRMLLCHKSQADLVDAFPVERECFRLAPDYDFRQPPYSGRLFYEHHAFGLDGAQWRELAAAALRRLGDAPTRRIGTKPRE